MPATSKIQREIISPTDLLETPGVKSTNMANLEVETEMRDKELLSIHGVQEEIAFDLLNLLNVFCENNLDLQFSESATGDVYLHEGVIYIPRQPTIRNLYEVVRLVDVETFGLKMDRYSQKFAAKIERTAKLLFVVNNRNKTPNNSKINLVCRDLLALAETIRTGYKPEVATLETTLESLDAEAPEEVETDFFIEMFLGGRESKAYERLLQKFITSRENSRWIKNKKDKIIQDIRNLESSLDNDKLIREKELELVRLLSGPAYEDFEDWIGKHKKFISKLAITYVGGQRTNQGIQSRAREMAMGDMQIALWERGVTEAMKNLRPTTPEYKKLFAELSFFATKALVDEQMRQEEIQEIDGKMDELLDSISPLWEQIDFANKLKQLKNMRSRYELGEINDHELETFEIGWLQEIRNVAEAAYPREYYSEGEDHDDYSNLKQLAEAKAAVCRYQHLVIGCLAMHAFPTFSGDLPAHITTLVELSNGKIVDIGNSGWPFTIMEQLAPFYVSRQLKLSNERPQSCHLKILSPQYERGKQAIARWRGENIPDTSMYITYFIEDAVSGNPNLLRPQYLWEQSQKPTSQLPPIKFSDHLGHTEIAQFPFERLTYSYLEYTFSNLNDQKKFKRMSVVGRPVLMELFQDIGIIVDDGSLKTNSPEFIKILTEHGLDYREAPSEELLDPSGLWFDVDESGQIWDPQIFKDKILIGEQPHCDRYYCIPGTSLGVRLNDQLRVSAREKEDKIKAEINKRKNHLPVETSRAFIRAIYDKMRRTDEFYFTMDITELVP